MTDFFRELEEDIKEERIFDLWHKYGNYLIGLALVIVIGTASYTLWKYFKHRSQLQSHTSFSSAVELVGEGRKEEALKAFQLIEKEGGGYGKLAQLYEAALLPHPEAIYATISKENISDPALGNLPKILMASQHLDNAEALNALEPLTAPNNAWAPLSREILALADLKKGDEVEAAKQYIKILKEPYSTSDEQLRTSLMLSQIDVPASLVEEEMRHEAQP